jgi:hypothetical protein
LTDADGLFIKRVSNGEDIHKVYKEVYSDEVSHAKKLLKDPEIIEGIKHRGVTVRRADNVLAKMYQAEKAITVSKDSTIEYVPDNMARLDAVKTTYKLFGVLKDKEVNIDNRSITFSGDVAQLSKVIAEMKELNKDIAIDTDGEVV